MRSPLARPASRFRCGPDNAPVNPLEAPLIHSPTHSAAPRLEFAHRRKREQRRREIGVLRAIGAGNVSLVQIFMAEGLTMGLLGWVLSIMLGYPLGLLFVHVLGGVLFQIAFVFPPSFLLLSFGFCLVLSITASLVPALGAARLPAQQALRYE